MELTTNKSVLDWINEKVDLVKPDAIVWIDGSEEQLDGLRKEAVETGEMIKLNEEKLPGCYLHRTKPNDVASVEDRTFICSKEKIDAKAHRAKGKANDILHFRNKDGQIESLKLLNSDKRLQFVQKLRDEAHRFAISFHKKQKRKEDKEISLHQITGIGPAKIKKLLLYFGEFEKIKNASFEELKEVLNQKDAQNIVDYFQKD